MGASTYVGPWAPLLDQLFWWIPDNPLAWMVFWVALFLGIYIAVGGTAWVIFWVLGQLLDRLGTKEPL